MNSLRTNLLFNFDEKIRTKEKGGNCIIGTDEAGRGPGAGGVFAAAVCFKENFCSRLEGHEIELLKKLNDSKKLTPKLREQLAEIIKKCAHYSIKTVEIEKIEEINILKASLYAMKLACEEVITIAGPAQILVDGNKKIPDFKHPQDAIKKGDTKSASIAAASILAKVERDFYMNELHKKYPAYNWAKNKGYLTKEHIENIKIHGTTPHHRKSFLKNIL